MRHTQQRSIRRTWHRPAQGVRRRSRQRTAAALAACGAALMVSACSGQTPDASASDSPEASSDATEQSDGQAADAAGDDEPADSSDSEKSSGPSKQSYVDDSSDSAPMCLAAD